MNEIDRTKQVLSYTKAQPAQKKDTQEWRQRPSYDGAELRRAPGIPDARFAAYALPSLVAGKKVYPRNAP